MTARIDAVRRAACAVLQTSTPDEKAAKAGQLLQDWRTGDLGVDPSAASPPPPPDRPARPDKPVLSPPRDVPRRRLTSKAGRIALLHAVAHIEFNAIDLACDMVARFAVSDELDQHRDAFVSDWLGVAADEARHFLMIVERLTQLDAAYGDLPAHDGLWSAAVATRHDIAARLAIAPMVLEARGLDVTPGMIERLRTVGDHDSADRLQTIYEEEIAHVAAGSHWFRHVCSHRGQAPDETFAQLVHKHLRGAVKPPFNVDARREAGLPYDWYAELAGEVSSRKQ